MPRTLLLVVLAIAGLSEFGLAGAVFFAPTFTLAQLSIKVGPETQFLAYITGWFLLLVALLAALAWVWALRRRPGYAGLCYLLGLWWIGLGVGIYVTFGRPDNLVLDSLKGLLLVGLAWRSRASERVLRR
ncbi:hypothetical protein [Hymenobacter sp. BT559]|uniref:hypothetical protein n=1 Tax=Hymenobacter sp. BT559 TaxID=2795729 RepID=UPI0018ECAB72|nr:hypothetical protein [Hymenobacter sp. BT559]MBJ6141895.1 hypothetical protein [Hymenobacter sp. BT559]